MIGSTTQEEPKMLHTYYLLEKRKRDVFAVAKKNNILKEFGAFVNHG